MDFCVHISLFLVVDNAITLFNCFFRNFRGFRGFDLALKPSTRAYIDKTTCSYNRERRKPAKQTKAEQNQYQNF